MLLAIDIGNTNIVAGVFAGDTLLADWRLATDGRRTDDEYAVALRALLHLSELDSKSLSGVVICSVVPAVQATIAAACQKYWGLTPLIISPALDLGVEIRYTPRTAVGADRVANAVAAICRYGVPTIVVDFGTATTFDAISADEAYIGGAIAPGLEISEEALYRHTAQLPRVPLESPGIAIGDSTASSIQSGILYGYAGLVDGLVERFRAELGGHAHVIATGGLSSVVAPHTRTLETVDTTLTLYGLLLLHQRNCPRAAL